MSDDEMKLYRAFMAAQLAQSPKPTPEQKAAAYAAAQNAPYPSGEGLQNISAALWAYGDLSTHEEVLIKVRTRWYHRLWWRVKRWWT